jgi:hypothetical protein
MPPPVAVVIVATIAGLAAIAAFTEVCVINIFPTTYGLIDFP